MNGSINSVGQLFIERGGVQIGQACRFDKNGMGCSHSCPHFGEPYKQEKHNKPDTIIIELCHNKYLEFENFTDERKS